VNDQVLVEWKAVEQVLPIHEAQLLSYLKLSACKVGLLISFKVKLPKDGIRRFAN
jgi:GxxExxY protein